MVEGGIQADFFKWVRQGGDWRLRTLFDLLYIDMAIKMTKKGAHLFKHGMCESDEYNIWTLMKGRCLNVKNKRYPEWGGRGITVCDRWKNDFMAFYEDMGARPSISHSLDRINNDGNYDPENCRWATKMEQSNNRPRWVRLIEFRGESMTITQWAKKIGIGRKTLYDRFENGWTTEEALTTKKLTSHHQRGVHSTRIL